MDDVRTVESLTRPEHLLVLALRSIAFGRGDCPLLREGFDRICGVNGGYALSVYAALILNIGLDGRRRLTLHSPGCIGVARDELAVLGVVAAGQEAVRTEDQTLLILRLRFLVQEVRRVHLLAAQTVASLFGAAGQSLPIRARAGRCEAASLRLVVSA